MATLRPCGVSVLPRKLVRLPGRRNPRPLPPKALQEIVLELNLVGLLQVASAEFLVAVATTVALATAMTARLRTRRAAEGLNCADR